MNEKKTLLSRAPVVFGLALICCMLWGSAASFIKMGYELFALNTEHTPSLLLFAGSRFTLSGILTILFGSLAARHPLLPDRSCAVPLTLLAATQTVLQYIFFYVGLAHTSGVSTSVITAASTFIAILLSGFVFRTERFTLRKLIGCLVGFGGVILINTGGGGFHFALNGEGLLLISVSFYALSSCLMKRYSAGRSPILLSGWQFFLGGAFLMLTGLAFGGTLPVISLKGIPVLLYLAFLSATAYGLWGLLLKYNPVSRVTVYGFMNPICGVLFSAALLGETEQAFRPASFFALLLVCIGIIIVNRSPNKQ